uniref:Metalloproteinase MP-NASE n=1 Tax=Phthorimaea operculella granulovirus TaxID=192584 RepID=A0A481SBC3_9BBAC|nr:metalloproteinase MP-NASE [Phthorimaea operculella granulovirus]QBH66656.1 metalloproteinase MP-NASE [Phthorimaea operculella granulovirus]QBH66786.1 metalloproteinase MP-NASE [Phthorimaea operculella granulovirus]QBH67045.1 metalloproteinase MP-NASE [Phthorimaea operculella granulovirus]QBH67175.1 metalloproteinase MP-NASE [Phthorimaea operculella granulovirus]
MLKILFLFCVKFYTITSRKIDDNSNYNKTDLESQLLNQDLEILSNQDLDFLSSNQNFNKQINVHRLKRFTVDQNIYWPNKNNITYSIDLSSVPKYLDQNLVLNETRRAFEMWQNSMIKFNMVKFNQSNISVKFYRGDHGDGLKFDGPGGYLAHAYPPPNGQIHLDADEHWIINDKNSADDTVFYFTVLLHEIGHALGLFHSSNHQSIMYHLYNGDIKSLSNDDTNGVDQLYVHNPKYVKKIKNSIKKITTTTTTTTEKPTTIKPEHLPDWVYAPMSNSINPVCEQIPTTVVYIRGQYYIFDAKQYWRYSDYTFDTLLEHRLYHDGLWHEMCNVKTATTIGNKIVLIDRENLWYEYNSTMLDKVRVLKTKYRILFEEAYDKMYAVDNEHKLYLYTFTDNCISDEPKEVGNFYDKFIGVRHLEWVFVDVNNVAHGGVGRGKWAFSASPSNDKNLGHIYHRSTTITPLLSQC